MTRKTKAQREADAAIKKSSRARQADVVIRIMAPEGANGEWNPYREGSNARDHLEKAKGGITVREYLAKFPADEQRVARQWLWNMIKAGHVKTLGG